MLYFKTIRYLLLEELGNTLQSNANFTTEIIGESLVLSMSPGILYRKKYWWYNVLFKNNKTLASKELSAYYKKTVLSNAEYT